MGVENTDTTLDTEKRIDVRVLDENHRYYGVDGVVMIGANHLELLSRRHKGDRVQIVGHSPEYDGKKGVVICFIPQKGRFQIKTKDGHLNVLPEHLEKEITVAAAPEVARLKKKSQAPEGIA